MRAGIIKEKIFGVLLTGLALQAPQFALAMTAHENPNGSIELRATTSQGMRVSETIQRQVKGKKFVYFCVKEGSQGRCFYAPTNKVPNLKEGFHFESIGYRLSPRIYNNKGLISIGSERYFYLVKAAREMKGPGFMELSRSFIN